MKYFELDYKFMGFTDVYKGILDIADMSKTIIDLGCYTAAQCYYFKDYKRLETAIEFFDNIRGYYPDNYDYFAYDGKVIRDKHKPWKF